MLLKLINDVIDLSSLEVGKMKFKYERCDAVAICRNVIDMVEKIKQTNANVRFSTSLHSLELTTDNARLQQLLINLLINATKFTPQGSITMELEKQTEDIALFSVTDTGCGISPENQNKIFNRFEKLNDFVQGTGLGLSICKSIVERLGGRIEVTSELGQGSVFALYLPYQEIPKEVVERRLPHKKNVDEDKRKKILVVEDIESNFAQLNILLNKEYIISWVRNGQEAINSFIREKPDLILMDIRMPIMDGIQATEKIRTISLTVPIVAVTAYAFYTEQQQAIQAGCNAVISKPYSLERLKETIESYIG